MASTVAAMLEVFGLDAPARHTDAVEAAQEVLSSRGHDLAEVVSLRYGVLQVVAPPAAAALLRMDAQATRAQVEQVCPGTVKEMVVRPAARRTA